MSRPQSTYSAVPTPGESYVSRGYVSNPSAADFAQGNPDSISPLAEQMSTAPNARPLSDSVSASENGAAGADGTTSDATAAVQAPTPSRSNTLKKRGSMRRTTSLKRSNSKKSLQAEHPAGNGGVDTSREYNSAFSTPIPTQGAPTEILANRFQAWRQLLKSLIAYFREIQASYDMRAKATHKIQDVLASIMNPTNFKSDQGLGEATRILDAYHKRSFAESNKSRDIEEDVISALMGLRNDLGQKIKEIKSLSSDFKNSVDKEKETTWREIQKLKEAIQLSERDDGSAVGKNDPFVVKLGVDRAVERQIDEENYLHRAYLNLESSGRELESIVVGEIQKAYNALAGILKREGDDAHNTVDSLRSGPIALPKDSEWNAFVEHDPHFVDPNLPLRRIEDIDYPGKHHASAVEVRAGMLERKSKYLKSYTPGWYVLSPTHLHEFKSADKIYSQPPVMSLYLPDQKLGSHSQMGSSSHKFMVKGKQSGNMHKGHNWVFRAETYDTMLAWFEDMRILTEKTGEERDAFVRKHARSFSGSSRRASMSSDGMDEDEADQVPYSAAASSLPSETQEPRPQRPQPGGRFPSDLQIQRARGESLGQSSADSGPETDTAMPVPAQLVDAERGEDPYRLDGVTAGTATVGSYEWDSKPEASYFDETPLPIPEREAPINQQQQSFLEREPAYQVDSPAEHNGLSREWVAPVATGAVGTTVGAAALQEVYQNNEEAPVGPSIGAAALDEVHRENQQALAAPQAYQDVTAIPETSEQRSGLSNVENVAVIDPAELASRPKASESFGNPVVTPPVDAESTEIDGLRGLESRGAHETGELLPEIIRHDTEVSVSQLHVPGKYPRQI